MSKSTNKQANDNFRNDALGTVMELFAENGEDILQIATNKITFPFVNSEGNDEWLTITFSIPTGSRDREPFDGYEQANEYLEKEKRAKERAEKQAEAKRKKIELDEKKRAIARKKNE